MRIIKPAVGSIASVALVTGMLSLATPALAKWYQPHCGSDRRRCFYEEGYSCPPCFQLQRCAPCGCAPIRGCTV